MSLENKPPIIKVKFNRLTWQYFINSLNTVASKVMGSKKKGIKGKFINTWRVYTQETFNLWRKYQGARVKI